MLRWLSVSFNYLPSIFFSWNHKQERDFPGGSVVKNLPAMQETQLWEGPWVGKVPWRREWQPTPVFWPGDPMDRGGWWAAVHRVAKSQTRLSMHT